MIPPMFHKEEEIVFEQEGKMNNCENGDNSKILYSNEVGGGRDISVIILNSPITFLFNLIAT